MVWGEKKQKTKKHAKIFILANIEITLEKWMKSLQLKCLLRIPTSLMHIVFSILKDIILYSYGVT